MNVWENAVITIQGLSLLSKLTEGNTLKITRAETGEGYVTPGLLNQLTSVSVPKQQLSFRTTSYPEEGKCKMPCYITNAGLAKGYTAKQVGVYATDPDKGEILFLIVQASSDQGTVIPSEAEMAGYSAEWNLYFQYGQASGVSLTVDPSNTVTFGDLEKIGGIVDVVDPVENIENLLVYDKEGKATTDIAQAHSGVFRFRLAWEESDSWVDTTFFFTQRKSVSYIWGQSVNTVDQEYQDGNNFYKRTIFFPIEEYPEFDVVSIQPEDSLESPASTVPLSANMGRVLNEKIEAMVPLYGTEDIEAGVTALETGRMYLVYE